MWEFFCSLSVSLGTHYTQPLWSPRLLCNVEYPEPWLTFHFCAVSEIVTLPSLKTITAASPSFSLLVDVKAHLKCTACHVQPFLNISLHSYEHFFKKEYCSHWVHKHLNFGTLHIFCLWNLTTDLCLSLVKTKTGAFMFPVPEQLILWEQDWDHYYRYVSQPLTVLWTLEVLPHASDCQKKLWRLFEDPSHVCMYTHIWVRLKVMFTYAGTLGMWSYIVLLFMASSDWSWFCWLPQSLQVYGKVVCNVDHGRRVWGCGLYLSGCG